MKARFALVSALLISLAGCATDPQPQWHWGKEGATNADFRIDSGQCHAQSFSASNPSLLQVLLIYDGCMQGKGWEHVQNE